VQERLGEIDEDGFLLARHLGGELKGKQGMVPSTFIQLEEGSGASASADGGEEGGAFLVRVLYDYDPEAGPNEEGDELSIREGQILRIFGEADDDGFYTGEHTDDTAAGIAKGMIPSNFVESLSADEIAASGVDVEG
jgi:hypothetical protein